MGTLKKETYKKNVYALLLILTFCFNAFAQSKEPAQLLIDSYKLTGKLTKEVAENTISELNQSLLLCTEKRLKFRIEYRIGIINFEAGELNKALSSFEKISQTDECPDIIKLCSFNMQGQIYRMQAKDDRALVAFEELIQYSKKIIKQQSNQIIQASVLKLGISACIAKAEIYQYNQNYDSAIKEYKKVIAYIKGKESFRKTYLASILDRLSQVYLIQGEIEHYNQSALELVKKCPDYYRLPLVLLETEAVRILKEKEPDLNFKKESYDTPVRLIALVKDSEDKEFKEKTIAIFKDLYTQNQQGYGGLLLGYHYSWILDASRKQNQAVEILENVCRQAESINTDMTCNSQVIKTLTDYAKLQQAAILGEQNRYRQALELIYSLKPDPNDVHIYKISDSIENALITLKREVPKDVNDQ